MKSSTITILTIKKLPPFHLKYPSQETLAANSNVRMRENNNGRMFRDGDWHDIRLGNFKDVKY